MNGFPGVCIRIQARLKALGYSKNGRPDILRFCQERAYRPQYLYAWLRGRLPAWENLVRLARDLDVSPEWVMFGTGEGPVAARRRAAPEAAPGARQAKIIDFARLREVTSRLVRLETELEAIFRAFPDLYFWLDADGTFLAHEAGRGSSFHVAPETVLGRKLGDAFPPEIAPRLEAAGREALGAGAPASVEFSLPSRAGEGQEPAVRSYEARFVPLADRPPAQPRLLLIVRDITERKRAEDATRALVSSGRELASTLDVTQAAERVVRAVVGIFRVRAASLFRLDPAEGGLVCVAVAGVREPAKWIGQRLPAGSGVSGRAVTERQPAWSSDVARDHGLVVPAWLRQLGADEGHGSVMSMPLVSRGEILGTLALADVPGRVFAADEFAVLSGFADQAALALQNARLFEDAERRRREAEVVADLARTINASLDLATVLPAVVEGARELCGSDLATIALREPGGEPALMRYSAGFTDSLAGMPIEPGKGLGGLVLGSGRPLRTQDYAGDPRFSKDYLPFVEANGIRTALVVPVSIDGRVEGLLYVHNRAPRAFTDRDESILARLADQAAIALRNARVYERSEHRRRAAQGLAEVGRLISQSLDPEVVAQRIADSVLGLFQGHASVLVRISPDTGASTTVAVSGDPWPLAVDRTVLPAGIGTVGFAVREGRAVASPDILADPRITLTPELRAQLEQASFQAELAAPLLVQGCAIGALVVKDRTGRSFDEEEARLLQAFADQAALALENARLYREAERARARAQAAAARTEQRFASLVRGLTGIVWEADPATWRPLSISPAVERVLGYPVARWQTEPDFWLAHLHPDDRARFEALRRSPALAEEGAELEYRMIAADGRLVWLSDRVRMLSDEHGQARRLHGVMVDVTESKLAAGAARALGEIGRLHAQSLDRDAVSRRIAESVRRLFGARVAVLSHVEPGLDGTTVVARAAGGSVPAERRDLLASDTALMRVAMREGRTLVSPDVLADPRVEYPPALREWIAGDRTRAVLAVPLAVRGAVLGVLAIGDTAGRTFDAREIRLAEAFADYAAVVLAGMRPPPRPGPASPDSTRFISGTP